MYYSENAARGCRDVEVVFARGSGQPQDTGETFLELQKDMSLAASQAQMSYRITDLNYEAVAITANNILGTYVSAGEAYSFGRSVAGGVAELKNYAKERTTACPDTYWVLAGYSQGAMVIQDSLEAFDADKIVYIMLFGDPKLYLPEGEGFNPPACRGKGLSKYRAYVPNCDTDNGILGARDPYEFTGLAGRYGLWCNDNDFICGSSKNPLNTHGHSLYEENGSIRSAATFALRYLNNLRQKPKVSNSGGFRLAQNEEKLSTVMAQLSEVQYMINSGETIQFDASRSFNVDEGELKYAWYVSDVRQLASGPTFSYRFNDKGMFIVHVVVTDENGASSMAKALVLVDWEIEGIPSTPSLQNVHAERCGGSRVCISWEKTRGAAKYLALRINDYFLGYTDVSNEELVIDDVDFSDIRIAVGAMSAGLALGDMTEVVVENNVEIVPTAVALPWWQILAIAALPFGFILLIRVVIRLLEDIARLWR